MELTGAGVNRDGVAIRQRDVPTDVRIGLPQAQPPSSAAAGRPAASPATRLPEGRAVTGGGARATVMGMADASVRDLASDEAVLAAVAAGDREALEILYRRHAPWL